MLPVAGGSSLMVQVPVSPQQGRVVLEEEPGLQSCFGQGSYLVF